MQQVAELLGVNKSTVKRRMDRDGSCAFKVRGNGGLQYRIPLDSLPAAAQASYRAQGRAVHHTPEQTLSARGMYDQLPAGHRAETERRLAVLRLHDALDPALKHRPRLALTLERWNAEHPDDALSLPTLQRWLAKVRGLDKRVRAPALAPAWRGGKPKAQLDDADWKYILAEWHCESGPALAQVYAWAKRRAEDEGRTLPSYATVARRIAALPETVKVARKGPKAVARLYPPITRDYSTLRLHQLWCADGRQGDVFCRWPDGTVGRPWMLAYQEMRTRRLIGWHVGRQECAAVNRLAFHHAVEQTGVFPEACVFDNGHAFAAKSYTGGQATTRYKFKTTAADPMGTLSLFGIEAIFVAPRSPQLKPIESWWNNVARAEKCKAFERAYCGNRPDRKNPSLDPKRHAVPIEEYRHFVQAIVAEANARAHRGDAMHGRSPDAVYASLSAESIGIAALPHQRHLLLCAAETVRLHGHPRYLTISGNRYTHDALMHVPSAGPFTVYFDPDDASVSPKVYDGARFICEAQLTEKTGFADTASAMRHKRAQQAVQKAERLKLAALLDGEQAARSWEGANEAHTPAPPRPAVLQISRRGLDRAPSTTPHDDTAEILRLRARFDESVRDEQARQLANGW